MDIEDYFMLNILASKRKEKVSLVDLKFSMFIFGDKNVLFLFRREPSMK